ncbi:GyrI-like domain-containing protein [Paenibacillus woosongensis]|uniref:AraC family transcriptional regulator n=1 Tax=Paenibacillus woosongensis TaxID=307580 RepID=A0A7X2YYK1_9BACL|nr:GyrI-like domain-containing protein [Paenibacillus woosongensis]MUG44227.1 AraC family transcriptional regulator [Paenibacillus woosongensis]
MNYEIVHVEEKTVAGLQIRTSNNDPFMSRKIGELWQRFYQDGIYQAIPGKRNDKSIGLYTHYEMDVNGAYDVIVCCEVLGAGDSYGKQSLEEAEIQIETIPAGKYAKFIVQGHMQRAVAEFWTKLWSMELDRKFSCDFEEYQSGGDMDNAEIHIYIALN